MHGAQPLGDLPFSAAADERQLTQPEIVVGVEHHLDEPPPERLERHVEERLLVDREVDRLEEEQLLLAEVPDHERRVDLGQRGDLAHGRARVPLLPE